RQRLRPLPRYRDTRFRVDGVVVDGQGQRVDDVQGEAECVVSRSQIRRGGRHLELQPHAQLSSRPRARAALTASTETRWVSISEPSAVCSAQDGSLSPWPVTVTAIVAESGTLPASAVLSSPATEAAEPGSTKMPSSRERNLRASRLSSSVTESVKPPEPSGAASARLRRAGLPRRLAAATVSGASAGCPSTRGAAPAVCTPHISGSLCAAPRSRYSF